MILFIKTNLNMSHCIINYTVVRSKNMTSLKLLSLLIVLLTLLCVQHYSLSDYYILGFILPCIFFHIVNSTTWVESQKLRWKLEKQGIKGPRPSIIYGNVPQMQRIQATVAKAVASSGDFIAHDYTSALFPYFEQWRKEYGLVYTYSTGNKQHLYVNKPELVKEMSRSNTLELGKPSYITKKLAPLLGNGILRSNGQIWVQQRKIVAPEFFMDKVKCMVGLMVDSAQPLLRKWEACIEEGDGVIGEIRVDEDLRNVSADVIARICFGSSYCKGKEIFSKLRMLQNTISKTGFLFCLPNFGLFPTAGEKESRSLEIEIDSLIWDTVKEREQESTTISSNGRDLLQMILEGALKNISMPKNATKHFIVDNCKNIYFAGHESTAVAASWCLMLLARHPDWQARIREEMHLVCPDGNINVESLPKLKMVTMVIQETMRLYTPAAFVSREALVDFQLGEITVPKGVCIWTLIPTLHRDRDIWGPDANVFNPERFANGISGACKVPQAYVPFGLGPRLCLGRNFAMVQLKVVLSMVIAKFSFSLSPGYRHSPSYRMIVEPGEGVQILIQKCKGMV